MLMIELKNFKNLENAPFLCDENSPVFFFRNDITSFFRIVIMIKELDRYPIKYMLCMRFMY